MDLKDSLPIGISLVALAVSGVSTWINTVRDTRGEQRTVSDQISTTLKSINDNMLESVKLELDAEQKGAAYVEALRAVLYQQNGTLLKHAVSLMEKNGSLVTAWEWNTVAQAQLATGDTITAEQYFLAAIKASRTTYDHALTIRSYAIFLFNDQRFPEGRDQFGKAVALLAGDDDYLLFTRASTYAELALLERTCANDGEQSRTAFDLAEKDVRAMANAANRDAALKKLYAGGR